MKIAYIGFGCNLGNRRENLAKALRLLAKDPRIRLQKVSPLYQTAPVGTRPQPDFFNAVAKIRTSLEPRDLMRYLQKVERMLGRMRHRRNMPRTIDLDILEYGKSRVNQPDLVLPHPRMTARKFVLKPLADLSRRHILVASRMSVQKMLARPDIAAQRVRRVRGTWGH